MSLYVEWLNKIKTMSTYEWLTDAQRTAYDLILKKWESQPFVCLCGPAGCGKTFVARLLAREHGYVYSHAIDSAFEGSEQILVDGEEYSRIMRDIARLRRLKRVIVLMRRPPQDRMPQPKIELTARDVRQFQHNLTKCGVLQAFTLDHEGTDLGEILRKEATARGEENVDS
jgi:hypothetical protein